MKKKKITMPPKDNNTNLPSLIQTLPRELIDEIYNLTFIANPGKRHIHSLGPPPDRQDFTPYRSLDLSKLFASPDSISLLHVSRSSRETFAASFFGGDGAVFLCETTMDLITFSIVFGSEYRGMIMDLRYTGKKEEGGFDGESVVRKHCGYPKRRQGKRPNRAERRQSEAAEVFP